MKRSRSLSCESYCVGQAMTIESSKGPMKGCYSATTNRESTAIMPLTETRSNNLTVRLEQYCSLGIVVIQAEQWVKRKPAKEPRPRRDSQRERALASALTVETTVKVKDFPTGDRHESGPLRPRGRDCEQGM